jgi:hypothetical protein
VPSATAHLAGALGVPTKLLLADQDDWRWSSAGNTSTWYPSVEILQRLSSGSGPADSWRPAVEFCAQFVKTMAS